jgi:AraC family transcriptional regulator
MDEFYRDKVNRVVDYIQANIDSALSLKELSQVACLSKYHFTRIFQSVIGETPYCFIIRLRLEKAAGLLLANPEKSITEIALANGFATSSSFAKSFKKHFKMSATQWRKKSKTIYGKKSMPKQVEHPRISMINGYPVWTFEKDDTVRHVVVEDIHPMKVAYIRNVGPYAGDECLFQKLSEKLFQWAVPREQIDDSTYLLNIYYDNPEITKSSNLRVMVAIPLLDNIKPSGSIGIAEFTGGKYAVSRFLLKSDEFTEAWHWMSSVWLMNSGYEWDDREAFERCYAEKWIDGARFFDVDIGIPVKMK